MSAKYGYYNKAKLVARSYRKMHRGNALTRREQEEKEAVERAVEWMEKEQDGEAKAKLIKAMYYKGRSMTQAAMSSGYSYDGAGPVHRRFIYKLAEYLGYVND